MEQSPHAKKLAMPSWLQADAETTKVSGPERPMVHLEPKGPVKRTLEHLEHLEHLVQALEHLEDLVLRRRKQLSLAGLWIVCPSSQRVSSHLTIG